MNVEDNINYMEVIMNIFVLDYDLEKCAQYHCDKHLRKQLLESVQMLQNAYYFTEEEHLATYKKSHPGNRFCKWTIESLDNWLWLRELAFELYAEYEYRFNKNHKSGELLLSMPIPKLPSIGRTPFVINIGDVEPVGCTVVNYRRYYNYEKRHLFEWTNRDVPNWIDLD